MKTSEFDFDLPPELIAQIPEIQRDGSRLLVLHRATGKIEHRNFHDLVEYLRPGDVLVLNNTRVIPARLRGVNAQTGGRFEILLLEENSANDWWAMLRPGKRARVGTQIALLDQDDSASEVRGVVLETNEEGHRRLRFSGTANIAGLLDQFGEVPLPPYITRAGRDQLKPDRERYQTVFAKTAGSIAAPTAGLHFTDSLLDELRARGVQICFLTLHVGLGTFAPVKAEIISAHRMHDERFELSEATAQMINDAKQSGRRVIAVGTTVARVLETQVVDTPDPSDRVARPIHLCRSGSGKTKIFLRPPCDFKIVDALLTNFHLPRSTLLMLVSAFAAPNETRGKEIVQAAYAEAIRHRYRFFSYGDAMLIS